jgi:hypothetical protein
VVFVGTDHTQTTDTSVSSFGTSPVSIMAWLAAGKAGIVMLVMWIGALIRLGQQAAWGWFAGVLVLHLVGLRVVGMIASAPAGPEDSIAVHPAHAHLTASSATSRAL